MQKGRKVLSHSEVQKLRREFDASKRDSQRDLQTKKRFYDSHGNASTMVVPPDSPHTLGSPGQMKLCTSAKPCRPPSASKASSRFSNPEEFHAGSPLASLPQSAPLPELPSRGSEGRSRGPEREAREAVDPVSVLVCTGQKPGSRPAIAQRAGTSRVISLSQRPKPPAKPRSEPPAPTARTVARKTRKSPEQEKGPEKKKKASDRRAPRLSVARGRRPPLPRSGPSSSDDSRTSEDSGSDQSEGRDAARGARRKKEREKQRDARPRTTSLEDGGGKERRGGGGGGGRGGTQTSRSPHRLLSATELLREAQSITGTEDQEDTPLRDQQMAPEGTASAARTLARERGRTVDEIIASLQSGRSDAPSASDLMIRELMGRILGDDYDPDQEEEQSLESKPEGGEERTEMESTPVHQEDVVYREVHTPKRPVRVRREGSPSRAVQLATPPGIYKMSTPSPRSGEDTVDTDLMASTLPHTVTYADVMVARGTTIAPAQRPRKAPLRSQTLHGLSLLATWAPKTSSSDYKTIHHLCMTPASHTAPPGLQLASRGYHTSSLPDAPTLFHQQRAAPRHVATQPDGHRIVTEGQACEAEPRTGLPAAPSESLADWKKIAEHYVVKPRMVLQGEMCSLLSNEFKMFWNPAPPKFSCSPAHVKHTLFPKYQATRQDLSNKELDDDLQVLVETACDVNTAEPTSRPTMENVLSRRSRSMVDLTTSQWSPQPSDGLSSVHQVKRPVSAPHLSSDPEASFKVSCDYTTITRELQLARQQLPSSLPAAEGRPDHQPSTSKGRDPPQPPAATPGASPGVTLTQAPPPRHRDHGRVVLGKPFRRASVSHARRKVSRPTEKLSPAKLAYVYEALRAPPHTITRSESLCQLSSKPALNPPEGPPLPRRASLPLVLDFQGFAEAQGGIPEDAPPREWVRDIWDAWFDELFPPLEESSGPRKEEGEKGGVTLQAGHLHTLRTDETVLSLDDVQTLDGVDLSLTLEPGLTPGDLEAEVARLTHALAQQLDTPSPFHLCRRGALHKKLGRLSQALHDLNAAISLEPRLLDAYWHRHSIYLLRNDQTSALEDLSFIIKHNKKHADAFKSKAEIYRQRGDTVLAISNYTEAIKCSPEDDENYFKRAEMYEKGNETVLAMEDYAKTFAANARRTDALMLRGLHYFNTCNWMVALSDFSLLLQQTPRHAAARTYRGRIYAKLGQYQEAISDFSLAVHLDPNDWLAFYHRGCLLRKQMPDKALQDLSTSILINDSQQNLKAFLHRGLLYTQTKRWQPAVSDFEAVIRLDRSVAVAHVNLGLIYMLEMKKNQEAIRMFSNALRVNPTYVRAYLCRAQAHRNNGDLKRALKDLSHATHMKPDDPDLYIMRGQCLCDMEQFDLAAVCIQYVAEMNKALGLSPIQQAAVQSFLGNDSKAVACLEAATNSGPSPPVLILLGKTQMKARKFTEAVESFRKAVTLLSPDETNLCNVPEAAEVFYLTGLCCMAQLLLTQALVAFSNAVKINPDYADAYHQRGLCRTRLEHSHSVQDFNRALFINPSLFQVYLSRAALYGAKECYSKAILNCSEAIRIQPQSVRAYLYRGALKFYLRVYKGAVEDLTMAIRIDNNCSFAHYNRGVCYQRLKLYELALRDYGIVLLFPRKKEIDLKVLINRALLYVDLGDYHNALQDFKAASLRSPEDASIHHALGVYHHRLGQLQESVEAYSQSMKLNSYFLEAYVGRGNAYMDYGHAQANKQAQRDYLSALHLNPLCSNARICLAYNLQGCGYFQRSWNQFTVATEIDPKCWIAFEGRAVVSLQMGHTYAAYQDINTALKYHPQSDQLLTNRGVINQYLGDLAGAMRDYQHAITLSPTYALAHFNAANLYFYNRQFDQACEYYSRAFELDPEDESAVLNRAITRTLLRKVPEALLDFSLALVLNPYSAHVYFNRANLYCSLCQYTHAERDLTEALRLQPSDALVYKLRADVRGHLGWTAQAVEDYRTAVELQEALEG